MKKEIKFTKMHGTGNDYIYVNTCNQQLHNPKACAIAWSRAHTGIGSDGLVLIGPSEQADFSMRIFNADGSEAQMCGNASRCIGKYVFENKLTQKHDITLETRSGIKHLFLHTNNENLVESVTVDMGNPQKIEQIKLSENYVGTVVSMGNPHLVIFVDDINLIDLEHEGPIFEHNPYFPDRTNVEFAQIYDNENIRMRVWERGSGITQACGTGACATFVAAGHTKRIERKANIIMDGGTLEIEWKSDQDHLFMTGPATKVFEGTIELEL